MSDAILLPELCNHHQTQQNYTRLGVFYFATTDDSVTLAPLLESPVLQRVGVKKKVSDNVEPPTMEAWRKGRTAAYGQSDRERRRGRSH